ncbi:MAG TPA: dihydrodipicolinate reductase [Anaeromyxobacteraceae bacterium]|nr:dihydrodipicolinate reductase [Anaeromyxobacteraceae bacterium]
MAEGANGIPVVVVGLGHIGQAIARAALERPDLKLVAAVDPAFAGRRLDEVLSSPAPALCVASEASSAYGRARGGVVLHATGSSFQEVLPEITAAVEAGLSVVSTCEELSYPWLRFEELAGPLDELCESRDLAVIGLGVNPGFVLDRLPAFLSQMTGPVRHIRGLRVQDVTRRRVGLRRKVGVGLSEDEFHAKADRGEIGHVGLSESAVLAALGCGFEIDEVEEELSALVAEEELEGAVPVKAGQVAGVQQLARGFADGTERVRLELVIAVDAEDPRDEVELEAAAPLKVTVPGGFPGDEATAWGVVNAVPAIAMMHGLVTVLDLPSGR